MSVRPQNLIPKSPDVSAHPSRRPVDAASKQLAVVVDDYRRRVLSQFRTFATAGFSSEQYRRMLSAHWHWLGVSAQLAFATAGHEWVRSNVGLQQALVVLGERYESARELAAGDLASLQLAPAAMPVDAHFWRLHFLHQLEIDQAAAPIGALALQDHLLSGDLGEALRHALSAAAIPDESRRCFDRVMAEAGEFSEPVWSQLPAPMPDPLQEISLWLGVQSAGLIAMRLYRSCLDEDCPSLEIEALLDPETLTD